MSGGFGLDVGPIGHRRPEVEAAAVPLAAVADGPGAAEPSAATATRRVSLLILALGAATVHGHSRSQRVPDRRKAS